MIPNHNHKRHLTNLSVSTQSNFVLACYILPDFLIEFELDIKYINQMSQEIKNYTPLDEKT